MNSRNTLILSLILNIVLVIGMCALGVHYRWIYKMVNIIEKKPIPRSQDYLTTISWNHTMESLSYEADVVFFGASITSDGHWEDYFDTLKICNLGKSGDRLETMMWRIPQITAVHPKKILLSMEQNDMYNLSLEEIEKSYNKLIDEIVRTNPQSKLYLESLTPLNERQFKRVCDNGKIKQVNGIIKKVAKERDCPYIDLYKIYEEDGQLPMLLSTDGQHLKPEAYDRWANVLLEFFR